MIIGDFTIPTYFGQLVMLAISIFLVALGISLYVGGQLVNMPSEGMVAAINQKFLTKHSFADVKVIVDTTIVSLGIIVSLIFLGRLEGIREGTVICAIVVGKLMKPIQKKINPIIEKLCF